MSDPETLAIYAERAAEYAALSYPQDDERPILEAFVAALPQGGKVLDLGCGPGASAARMVQAGLEVDACDAVAEMVALARQHKAVNAWQASFDALKAEAQYDGIWANFSLLHAPREDLPAHLSRIAKALKPGGLFHIAVKTGKGSARDRIGRLYTYYSVAELTDLLTAAGFKIFDMREGRGKGLSGEIAPWVALAARHG